MEIAESRARFHMWMMKTILSGRSELNLSHDDIIKELAYWINHEAVEKEIYMLGGDT